MLTIEFIKANFHKYNKKYFNGELEEPSFEITKTKNRLGCCKWRTNYFGEKEFTIEISRYFQRPEKDYINTLIHEMIHLYIRQKGIYDGDKHHGPEFYRWADKINQDGWEIARTNSVEGCDCNVVGKVYQVCIYHNKNKEKDYYFEFVLSPQKVNYYFDMFYKGRMSDVDDYFFFQSTDSKRYASYSACRTRICGHYISKEEFERLKEEHAVSKRKAV